MHAGGKEYECSMAIDIQNQKLEPDYCLLDYPLEAVAIAGACATGCVAPAVRELLPLPLVPARDRLGVRINAMIEADRVELAAGDPIWTHALEQRKGQKIARCP
jgi:hypothetical protein